MIALIGDIHGDFSRLPAILKPVPSRATIIQVGDFGWWPGLRPAYLRGRAAVGHDFHILFIDGNHDHVGLVGECNRDPSSAPFEHSGYGEPWWEWPGVEYVPRGEVRVVDGKRVLFLGGANSLDRAWRPHNLGPHAWFDGEVVSEADVAEALENAKAAGPIDLMVSHSPPDFVIRRNFNENGLRMFGHDPRTWRDDSALRVEQVWQEIGEPPLYCGHMHRSVVDGKCRILNIDEVALFGS